MVQACSDRIDNEWVQQARKAAAKRGRLDVLQLLHQQACDWNTWQTITEISEEYGHIDIYKWIRTEKGVAFLSSQWGVCRTAARFGQLASCPSMGPDEWLPMDLDYVLSSYQGCTLGGATMDHCYRMRLVFVDVLRCCSGWPFEGAAMGPRQWMRVGQIYLLQCCAGRSFGSPTICPHKWLSMGLL